MILGLDVGGTQTDTVLIGEGGVLAELKTPTGDDLLETLRTALDGILQGFDPKEIERMVFSTTMVTNAIVQDRLDPVGMIVSAGPGMDPMWFSIGPSFHVVEGCLDHQGFEAKPLRREGVLSAASRIRKKGIERVGVVGKFSVRNPAHELQIAQWLKNDFSHIALGHRVSGILNFPRRIATTYLNAGLHRIHSQFAQSLLSILKEKDHTAPRYLLKPDGGTVELDQCMASPAGASQSGPAASVMGALALDGCEGACLVLDIGGTTTDMAVVLDGVPLLDPHGVRLGTFRTLIRSLFTQSIGVGGDSEISVDRKGRIKIGPLRKGKPIAFGGSLPTPTDAMATLGLLKDGNSEAAKEAMARLGGPLGVDPLGMAERVLKQMAQTIALSVEAFVYYLNSRPVYTVHEVLEGKKIAPDSVLIIGGPAPQLAPYVGEALGLPHRVPAHYDVANAVGAAVARVTSEITLQADTSRGTVIVPEANLNNRIDYRFNMEDALRLAQEVLRKQALGIGADPDALEVTVAEQLTFNMVRGYSRIGQNIRLKMCITPGLIPGWQRSVQPC